LVYFGSRDDKEIKVDAFEMIKLLKRLLQNLNFGEGKGEELNDENRAVN